jgi:hypothetical protein
MFIEKELLKLNESIIIGGKFINCETNKYIDDRYIAKVGIVSFLAIDEKYN